jgi:CheY-like chemotaxis protein
MRKPNAILVAETDEQELFGLIDVLRDAGYDCTGAATYDASRQLLSTKSFDLLVADASVGQLGGLQLIRESREVFPGMEAIALTSDLDDEARRMARQCGAPWLDRPIDPPRLLKLAGNLMERLTIRRRWVRKRPPAGLDAFVEQFPASLVDVCYGGVQFEMTEPDRELPAVLQLALPALDHPLTIAPVWIVREGPTHKLRCGATLLSTKAGTVKAWRGLVDSLPVPVPEPRFTQ